jgi:hypothetical protein
MYDLGRHVYRSSRPRSPLPMWLSPPNLPVENHRGDSVVSTWK